MSKFEQIRDEAKSYFHGAAPSHDWNHTERVYELCMKIGKKEKADLEILKLASILHDIGRLEQDKLKGKICHAEKGAILAKDLLKKYNFSEEIISEVVHCVECHRFRDNKVPQSKEAKILYDADKLDAIGAIGLGRSFSFAGEVGAEVHIKNLDVENSRPYTKEDCAYREFLVKLNKVKDKMLTSEGKKLALDRHNFMVEFFERLNKEVDGEL